MQKTDDQKILEVETALDGGILKIAPPYTGTGDGRVIELESILKAWSFLDLLKVFEIKVEDINAFEKAVMQGQNIYMYTFGSNSTPVVRSGDGLVSAYRFRGLVLKISAVS